MKTPAFYQLKREEIKRRQALDEMSARRVQQSEIKRKLLSGSRTRITLLSLQANQQIEAKYSELYGDDWRKRLSSKTVSKIEKTIQAEKRAAWEEIETRIANSKASGRTYTKTFQNRR